MEKESFFFATESPKFACQKQQNRAAVVLAGRSDEGELLFLFECDGERGESSSQWC